MAMTKPLLAAEARLAKLVINRNSMTSRGIPTPLRFMAFLLTAIYVVRKPFVPRGKHSRLTGNLKLSWARSPVRGHRHTFPRTPFLDCLRVADAPGMWEAQTALLPVVIADQNNNALGL